MSSAGSMSSTPEEKGSKKPNEYEDAEKNFNIKSPKFWIIIVSMYMAIFLVALDRLIIAAAIPKITNEFNSIEDIGWYGSAYMLTAAVFNPLSGRIYQLFPTKWVYLTSILIFEAGSALCGGAPNSPAFIVGRAIAGMGAAGVFTGGIMIMIPLIPLRRRPTFTAIFGLAFGISSVLGPLIGGSFTDNVKLTWRWCFYINLPIGGFTMVMIFLLFHLDTPSKEQSPFWSQLKRLDPLGLLFFVPSMVCLVLALQWGGSAYPWSAPRIIGLLVVFAVTFVIFLIVEVLTPETAMAPTRVVANRSVAGAMLFMLLMYGVTMSTVYYLTIWFQAVQDQSAMQSGIRTIPLVLSLVIFGLITAKLVEKIGYYVPAILLSPVLCAVGSGMLSTLTPSAGANLWIGYQVIFGLGLGAGTQPSNLAPQTVLPRADVPLGMALMFFMQQLGGAIFLAVSQNIFSNQLVNRLSGVAGLDAADIINTGATNLRNVVPSSQLSVVIDAFNYSLTRVFIFTAALSACMILSGLIMEWRSIKDRKESNSKVIKAASDETEGQVKSEV